jgi:hypothetical protein
LLSTIIHRSMSHWLIVVSTSLPRVLVKVLHTVCFGRLWSCCVRRGKRIMAFVVKVLWSSLSMCKADCCIKTYLRLLSRWSVDCQVIPLSYPRLFRAREARCGCRRTNLCSLLPCCCGHKKEFSMQTKIFIFKRHKLSSYRYFD